MAKKPAHWKPEDDEPKREPVTEVPAEAADDDLPPASVFPGASITLGGHSFKAGPGQITRREQP